MPFSKLPIVAMLISAMGVSAWAQPGPPGRPPRPNERGPGGERDPGRGPGGGPGGANSDGSVATFVSRMMSFDADKNGKLTRAEVTDTRLQPLFVRADADKDGTVTQDELKAFHTKESATLGSGRSGPPGPGGSGGPGGRGGPRPNGPPPGNGR